MRRHRLPPPSARVRRPGRRPAGDRARQRRIPDTREIRPDLGFEQPFPLAMANLGRDSTGPQFFITLAPTPRLNGQYTIFGQVADERSQDVVRAIAAAPTAVRLGRVTIAADQRSRRRRALWPGGGTAMVTLI
ncbi:peptidyl-prolyl cis-trans isomerase [Streptomyces lividans TK24]|nr:peptidyl-prolyl cis-trans isomerase [Streptomyces lividans TK24]